MIGSQPVITHRKQYIYLEDHFHGINNVGLKLLTTRTNETMVSYAQRKRLNLV